MKKLSVLFVLLLTVVFVNAQESATFNLSMTVNEYIETMPQAGAWDLGTTVHSADSEIITVIQSQEWDLAYANCPFEITFSGTNASGGTAPRFVRKQEGDNAGGIYDVLPTALHFDVTMNGQLSHEPSLSTFWGAGSFPQTIKYNEAPHNGQVKLSIWSEVNTARAATVDNTIPVRQTLIDNGFGPQDSADAGVYSCEVMLTLTTL